MNKLRLNFSTGEFELEGTDAFVALYFEKLNDLLSDNPMAYTRSSNVKNAKKAAKASHSALEKDHLGRSTTAKSKSNAADVVKVNPNLNLRGGKDLTSFTEFFKQKNPQSNPEFNAVAVFYLEDHMSLASVTLSDAFTCYKEVNRRPPEHFKQAFIDTKNKKSWIGIDKTGNLSMTPRGRIFVEHDLPKPEKKKA